MPLIRKISRQNNSTIYIWLLEESVESLESQVSLSSELEQLYSKISSQHRKKEWLASKVIVQQQLNDNITYTSNRAPRLLSGSQEISVSHSNRLCCVMVHDRRCGVDIESCDRDFERVAKRFLNNSERRLITTNREMCVAWCAKEAIYKLIGRVDVDFSEDFNIIEIGANFVKIIYQQNEYSLTYIEIERQIVCFTD